MEVLKCINIKKQIKDRILVEKISFSMEKGDIVGLIGQNGSGKTTIIKLILGLIKPNEGKIFINGFDIQKDFIKAIEKVGAIVESPDLYTYLSGYDNLRITANNYKNISKQRINKIIKIVGLENRIKDKVSTYSLGMRQRLGIAEALVNSPELLILDEPTNGLDVEGIGEIRNLIKELSNQGIAILISSHNLTEIDNLCNRIIVVKKGKIINNEKMNDFKKKSNEDSFIIELNKITNIKEVIHNHKIEIMSKNSVRIFASKNDIPSIINELLKKQFKIYSVQEEKITSEEAFIKKIGENESD